VILAAVFAVTIVPLPVFRKAGMMGLLDINPTGDFGGKTLVGLEFKTSRPWGNPGPVGF